MTSTGITRSKRNVSEIIDLRSDTVTRPSRKMREVMAGAPVGDDQFGEDPTVNLLQDRVAALLGKESALWLPTGTMANQVALRVLTRPGDDVIVSKECHAVWHETGGSGANSGVQFTAIGDKGTFTAEEFLTALKPRNHIVMPPTTLVEIENTHNRAGGVVFPQHDIEQICSEAKLKGIATYLDGARLWNVSVASGIPLNKLAEPFELASVALSKGLGAPGGSLLAGSKELIGRCVRHRRIFGGAMRQVGIFAAAGLYAIDSNFERLAEDHSNARLIAEKLAAHHQFIVDLTTVQTNILIFSLTAEAPDAGTVVALAREQGILAIAFGPRTIRIVTHLDVTQDMCLQAAETLLDIVEG